MGSRMRVTRAHGSRSRHLHLPYVQHERGLGPEKKGSCMTRSTLRPLLASVVAALALVVAACGGSDSGSSTGSSSSGGGSAANQETGGKQGGVLKQLGSTDVDYLDPGHTHYTARYQVLSPTQRTLHRLQRAHS